MQTAFYCALFMTCALAVGAGICIVLARPSQGARRMLQVVRSQRPDRRVVGRGEALRMRMGAAFQSVSVRLGLKQNAKLKRKLELAGMRDGAQQQAYQAMRMVLLGAAVVAAVLMPGPWLFWMVCLPVLSYLLPDVWLKLRTKRRRRRVRRSIPDAVDLLGICVEAGLGLDQALIRVGAELAMSYPELSEELTQVHLEQRAGRARLDAWAGLAERTQIEEFKGWVSMLMQTERFGTPIAKALNSFSEDIRAKRRQRAEEAAAKTKIKIVFPLVLCIFPCVFLVLLAPALMSIGRGLASMTQ